MTQPFKARKICSRLREGERLSGVLTTVKL